jgi:tetratricopeptide (TPR) repeat protein
MKAGCQALALSLVLARGVSAGVPPVSEPALRSLAERYRSGDRAQAIAEIRGWDEERIWQEAERLFRAAPRRPLADVGARRSLLAAAALLTEAAVADAQDQIGRAALQVQAASRLVRLLPVGRGCAECDAFAHPFTLVAVTCLRSWSHIQPAYELAVQGVKDFPQDAELWVALGSILESVASMRTYDPLPEMTLRGRMPLGSGTYTVEGQTLAGRLPPASLAEAERHYLRALQNDPGHRGARLRLGNVRALQGRAAEAVPDLERVALESPIASERYLARLFEGRAREQLGDIEGAVRVYAAAVEAVPSAQSGQLALGRALDLAGERARAQEAFSRASRLDLSVADPWLAYCGGEWDRSVFEPRLGRLLEALP